MVIPIRIVFHIDQVFIFIIGLDKGLSFVDFLLLRFKTRHKNAAPHKAESFGIAVNAWMNAMGSPRVDHDNKLEGITRTGGGKVVDA